ncbi:hypothetical protein ACFL24_01250 [Patescibacteria group bacterium]
MDEMKKEGIKKGVKIGIWIGLVIGIVITLIFFIFVAVTGVTLYCIGFSPEIFETFVEDELCPLTKYEGMEIITFIPIEDEGAGCFLLKKETKKGTTYTPLLIPAGSMIHPVDPKAGDIVKSVLFDDIKNRHIIELKDSEDKDVKDVEEKTIEETEKPKITMTEEVKEPTITKVGSPLAKKWRTATPFSDEEMRGADTN